MYGSAKHYIDLYDIKGNNITSVGMPHCILYVHSHNNYGRIAQNLKVASTKSSPVPVMEHLYGYYVCDL